METVYVSNSGHEFVILSKNGKDCLVRFLETGTIKKANIDNIRAGKVRDVYAVSVYGVGHYGDFEKVPFWKQAKQLWQNMLKRCYCKADERGYYGKGVVVCQRWHCFANFLEDIQNLPNFALWLEGQRGGPKYNLDKDLIVPGNTVYAPEVCAFVTEYENKAAGARNGKPYTKSPKKKDGRELTTLV